MRHSTLWYKWREIRHNISLLFPEWNTHITVMFISLTRTRWGDIGKTKSIKLQYIVTFGLFPDLNCCSKYNRYLKMLTKKCIKSKIIWCPVFMTIMIICLSSQTFRARKTLFTCAFVLFILFFTYFSAPNLSLHHQRIINCPLFSFHERFNVRNWYNMF